MESIFLNLITNAIKYSKDGEVPKLYIHAEIVNNMVKLYFEDEGKGMDFEKVKGKIFRLYQRFHHNADSKGIGLYLVHSQITALGGSIEVSTFVDKGSVFVLTFKQACITEFPINN